MTAHKRDEEAPADSGPNIRGFSVLVGSILVLYPFIAIGSVFFKFYLWLTRGKNGVRKPFRVWRRWKKAGKPTEPEQK